jgi:tetratricopeptide (TPR) repeat protein
VSFEVQEPEAMVSKGPTPIVRDAAALLRRGIEELEFERIEEAVGLLRQAASLDAESHDIWLALGIALMRSLEIPEALGALEKAVELEPKSFFAHFRTAELYLRVGVPIRAREELRLAMDLSTSPEQRQMVRQLLRADDERNSRRIWRPDFSRLLGKPRRKL